MGAVLLAAGAASRMGHRPKCLLEHHGQALVRRQAMALQAAGMAPVVIVLGHYRDRVAAAVHGLPIQLVVNPDPAASQNASLRQGLAALPTDLDAVLVTLADLPLIGRSEIDALVAAYQSRPNGTAFVRPWVDGQPGHPVLFDATVRQAILASPPESGGQQWAQANPQSVHRWPTPNHHHITDIDSPQDLATLAEHGVHLRWPPGDAVD